MPITCQRGSVLLDGSELSEEPTITAVVLAQTIALMTCRADSITVDKAHTTDQISDTTHIKMERGASGSDVNCEHQVLELDALSGMIVQRGVATMSTTTVDVPIDSVDMSKTFVIASMRNAGEFQMDEKMFIGWELTSSTNLRIHVQLADSDTKVEWQVCEYQGCKVQRGTLSYTDFDDAERTVTIPTAVVVDDCVPFISWTWDPTSVTNRNEYMIRAKITATTTLTLTRHTNRCKDGILYWEVVEFTDDTVVDHAERTMSSSTTSENFVITSVDRSRTFALLGGFQCRGGSTPYTSNDDQGADWATVQIPDDTHLDVIRANHHSNTMVYTWYVITFPVPSAGGIVPTVIDQMRRRRM